ncbi:MAG: RNase adapter RapZ [Peptococcaceae bacterium]|nr:RNase adapter RapZ [Peptococcaceae bacterium]
MHVVQQLLNLVVITGLSGAGKTETLRCMEDIGFYCVDNMPPSLLEKFAELCAHSRLPRAAVVCDLRGGEFFTSLVETLSDLASEGIIYEVLYLEASDEVLVNRYKESRRRHPVAPQGNILEGITVERRELAELRGRANMIIDTSDMSTAQLNDTVRKVFGKAHDPRRMTVSVQSFGFKYGIPLDADTMIDVRFLPNPYYIHELKELCGNDEAVRDYVFGNEVAREFMRHYYTLLDFMLPHYLDEGKNHLVVAIGCTGGQHRSVAIANETHTHLKELGYYSVLNHRDLFIDEKE